MSGQGEHGSGRGANSLENNLNMLIFNQLDVLVESCLAVSLIKAGREVE